MRLFKLLFNWKLWLLLLVVGGYLAYKPEILGNPVWTRQINTWKAQVTGHKLPNLAQIGQVTQTTRNQVLGTYSEIQQQNLIPGLPKEIVVDQAVTDLTKQLQNLPQEQLKQVKRQFCQDVIDEATASGKK